MRKIYLFMLTLICAMGVTSANAEKTNLTLNAASAQSLYGTRTDIGSGLPTAEQIVTNFGTDDYSTNKMVYGVGQGQNYTTDFRNGSETGFSFYGRGRVGGEYVAQVYNLNKNVYFMYFTFKLTGSTSATFSVWKISNSTATRLTQKTADWTSGQNYTFCIHADEGNSETPLLGADDRLVVFWDCNSLGVNIDISDFKAAAYDDPFTKKNVTVRASENNAAGSTFESSFSLPVAEDYPIKSFLPESILLDFDDSFITVTDATSEVPITYTERIPFATNFDDLNNHDKWVSMFTKNGRMHVYDDNCNYGSRKRYPTIDRATFANLSDRKFWGFIHDPFTSSTVKIVNKGAKKEKGTLYLTDGSLDMDIPLLFATEQGSNTTNEWVIEKGQTGDDGVQYYCVKASGTSQYINNYNNAGFMTTYTVGAGDNGSNIKFTSELDTYNLLKERALAAPYNAVHSLTQEARALIIGSTVEEYQREITAIQEMENDGVIPFVDGAYYYLRNYTPVGEDTYVLNSTDGSTATTAEVPSDKIGNISEGMKFFDINSLWKIAQADPNDEGYMGGSTDIGVSKTIGRYVTHANSGNVLTNADTRTLVATPANRDIYYFVNLGAGQHFLKNAQYAGDGSQASARPLIGVAGGTLSQTQLSYAHKKNTRDTWYGIPVTSFEFELHKGVEGDESFYATAHLPFAISIDETEGVKAYTVGTVDKENGVLNLKEIKGTIPANTAMVLIGGKNKVTVNIKYNATETAEANDYLQGVNMARDYDDEITKNNVLVLGTGSTGAKVGFYLPADASTGLRSNSAYIPVSALDGVNPANGLKFNFGGVANGIDGVNADSDKSDVIYDLQGRRVNKFSKGLYIVNGKKVIL